MQAVLLYGRVVARALASGITEFQVPQKNNSSTCAQQQSQLRSWHLVTASAGLSKSHSSAQIQTKWSYGDDAYFIACHNSGDVIGK